MAEQKKCSDPCQVPVKDPITKAKRICGEVHPTLAHHVKKHVKPNGKKWTSVEYRKAFPNFSMGIPPAASPEAQKKFIEAASNRNALLASKEIKDEEAAPTPRDAIEAKVQHRFEELWDQINRDVAAKQFALEAARCETRLEDLNLRYDRAYRLGEFKKMNDLLEQISALQKMLQNNMNFLDLSVKNRREKNQLGNDTVAQLVSNFAGTLRRMSPERREIFDARCRDCRAVQQQRLREKTLFELTQEHVVDTDAAASASKTEAEYDEEILKYVDGVAL